MDNQGAYAIKQDIGITLSQQQYDLMLNYLKSGDLPDSCDINFAELGNEKNVGLKTTTTKNKTKRVSFRRFRAIAKRLRYRPSDNSLIFYSNAKIVLPNSRFVEVIKDAHENKGDKHLSITKTISKLSEKYTISCRQFGMSEEMVREVIHRCNKGSCKKYFQKKTFNKKSSPKKLEVDISTTVSSSSRASIKGKVQKPLQPSSTVQVKSAPSYLAIPCLFPALVSANHEPMVNQGGIPVRPCLIFAGKCQDQISDHTVPCRVSSPETCEPFSSTAESLAPLPVLLMPTPSTALPRLAQLLGMASGTPPKSVDKNSTAPHQNMCPDQSDNSGQTYITVSPLSTLLSQESIALSDTSNTQINTVPDISKSLTNISQTVGAINLQHGTPLGDVNNNNFIKNYELNSAGNWANFSSNSDCHLGDLQQKKDDHKAPESRTDKAQTSRASSGCSKSGLVGPGTTKSLLESCLEHPHIWYRYTDIKFAKEPISRFVEGVKDLRQDIFKAMAGSQNAADQLTQKITAIEGMVQHLKQLSQTVGMDSEDEADLAVN